jgi:lipopolysaccharide transport system permease protein
MTLSLVTSLSELPEYRRVLRTLVARDLKVKYQTKALGFLWSLLYPALMIGIWYVVFNRVMRINMPHYWAFLIVGILPFQFVQNGINEGAGAVRRNAALIRKVYMPMEVLVIAGVTVKLIEFLLQLGVAVALLAVAHRAFGGDGGAGEAIGFSFWRALVVLPGAVLLLYFFVLGVSLPLAAWTVIYRDLEHIVGIGLMMLFYLTPVFWSLTLIGDGNRWKLLFLANPVMHLIDLFRGPLYWGVMPSPATFALALLFTAVSFVGGYTLFDRSKHVLAEVV